MSAPDDYRLLSVIGEDADPAAYLPVLGTQGEPVILSPGHAFEVALHAPQGAYDAVLERARAAAAQAGAPHDINLVPQGMAGRRKQLLVADMDSTIINVECLDELADVAGIKPEIAAITERAMRGELDFEAALKERVGRLKGLGLHALERTYLEKVQLNPGARILLATMRAHGAHTMLVSGGFGYFTARVAEAAGFHENFGNTLLDDGVALTGEVGMPILGREAKVEAMTRAAQRLGLAFDAVLAVGDGANDLGMIQEAGLGVAYHAKPVVAQQADCAIRYNDLTALLYLQGYKDAEFVRVD